MIILNQRDPRWSSNKLLPSNLTVGRYGCTTTCISMLSDYFGCFLSPSQMIGKAVNYTKDGMIIWESLKFDCMAFNKRIRSYSASSISESLKNPDKACILAIDRDAHWVVAIGEILNYYRVVDPWDGQKKFIAKSRVSGSAHFIRVHFNQSNPSPEKLTDTQMGYEYMVSKGFVKTSAIDDTLNVGEIGIVLSRYEKYLEEKFKK